VVFSIDGLERTHDFLRGVKGSFRTSIENIKLFNERKRKLGKDKPSLEITSVLNIHNYKEIPLLVKLAHSLKIKNVNVEPICINNPKDMKLRLNLNERMKFLKKILPKAKKMAKKYNINNNFEDLEKIKFIEKTGELKELILKHSENNFWNLPCYEPWLWPKYTDKVFQKSLVWKKV
jgi:UbiD family decarboxylase